MAVSIHPAPIIALFDGLGGLEMLVIFVLALMLFGGKRLPEVAKGLGKSIREFKRAASGVEDEIRRAMDMDSNPHHPPPHRRQPPAKLNPAKAGETPDSEPGSEDSSPADYTDYADHADHSDHAEYDSDHDDKPGRESTDPKKDSTDH